MRNAATTSPLRIGLVITELDPGGAELCMTRLATYLKARGHEVQVWALGSAPRGEQAGLVEQLQQESVTVHFGNARGSRDAWRIARWLKRSLAQFQPDVVQSMLWHANVITGWALWNAKTPWVAGMRVSEPRSGRWWLERLVSRRMQHMVCVSKDVMRHAIQCERIPPGIMSVIPNGVTLPSNQTSSEPDVLASIGLPQETPVLLFVGRLETQKGMQPLAEHLPGILRRLPQWHVVFVGQGSLRDMLAEKIQAAQLADRVHLVGWQSNAIEWMKASQLLLLPAIYEGMPNVILEAMSVARPFVAFAVDGIQQLVSTTDGYPVELAHAQTAVIGNWQEFIARIETLAGDIQLREQCGLANRMHVAAHFGLEEQLAKYERLYYSLAPGGTG